MQLISKEKNRYKLRPENLEDLWILSQIITEDNILESTTERKVQVGSENNPKQVKKIIHVKLKVSKVSFDHETLKISGEIQNETEFTAIGSSHTLNFNEGMEIDFQKEEFLEYEHKLLKQSLESKKGRNLLILLDKDELLCAEFGEFSYKLLFEKGGLGSKKYNLQDINEEEEKYKIMEPFLKNNYDSILIGGPSLYAEKLRNYFRTKKIESIAFIYTDINEAHIQKAIEQIHKSGILKNNILAKERKILDTLLLNIKNGEKSSYGDVDVKHAVESGRVDHLLITSKHIDDAKEEKKYKDLNELMKKVEMLKGELVIISSEHETGKVLDGLGGIGAILRY